MAITLYGRKSSANVQKVLWALEELGIDYAQIDAGGRFGGLDDPEFGARNPNRLIPVLEDDGLVVWESHAILRYLAATYGGPSWWPASARERATIDQWTEWASTTFQPAWIAVFWSVVRTPPERHDAAMIAQSVARTEAAFALLDAQIARTGAYVCGVEPSIADLAIGAAMYRWTTMDIARQQHPAVAAWYGLLQQRPAFAKTVMVSYEELRARSVP